jgi:hypothetical protein
MSVDLYRTTRRYIPEDPYSSIVSNLRNIMERIRKYSACYLLPAGFLLGLFFDPEDGGDMFLRNVG